MPVYGPPRFLLDEVVKITQATGQEEDIWGVDDIDVTQLIGEDAVIVGAVPSQDCRGWVFCISVPATGDDLEVPEQILEPTGQVEILESGGVVRVPLDPQTSRPWRDDVMLWLQTRTYDAAEADTIARLAAERLRSLSEVSAVEWRVDHLGESSVPAWVSMWVWSDGDALCAFARIVDLAEDGWEIDDDRTCISSRWTAAKGTGSFLAEGICEASVSYRRWTDPRRRSRSELKHARRAQDR
jgi:hypothetical protein